MSWLASTVDGDAGSDIAAELLSDDALRTDEDGVGLEVGFENRAERLVSNETFVGFFLDACDDFIVVEHFEGFADGELVGLARWRILLN